MMLNYVVFCAYDGVAVPGAANAEIKFSNFLTPFQWGTSQLLKGQMAYAVSTNYGCLAAYKNEAGVTGLLSHQSGLSTSDWTPAIIKNTKR